MREENGLPGPVINFIMSGAVPDCLPAEHNKLKTDLYMFFVNSKTHTIVPVWNINYAYGHLYNGYGPVGKDLPDFSLDLDEYSFKLFTPWDEEEIKKDGLDEKDWPARARIFPYGKRRSE